LEANKNLTLVERVTKQLEKNKRLREEGKDIAIPFPFPRFSEEIPGIVQGRYYIVTAGTKVGKSKLSDFLFLYTPFKFIKSHNTNIKIKILYFSLEMSKEDKVKEAISHFLHLRKGIRISPDRMDSIYKSYILENHILKAIEEVAPEIDELFKHVEIYDNIRNPFGIYKTVRKYAHSHGHYIDAAGNVLNTQLIESGNLDEIKKIFLYIPDDPDEFVIVLIDHVSLIDAEKDQTIHQAVSDLSSKYILHMRNRWRYIPVLVQQQMLAQESVENIKADMVRPSPAGLGENKLTSRDCDVMLGLFSPMKIKRAEWEGYNIRRMRDSFRELSVPINRRGNSVIVGLYFDGMTNSFKELPPAEEMTEEIYKIIESRNVKPI